MENRNSPSNKKDIIVKNGGLDKIVVKKSKASINPTNEAV